MDSREESGSPMQARPIRRKDRALSPEDCAELLNRGEYGVLATADAAGQPYAVPMSYVVMGRRLYFHSAREGHKIDNIQDNPRASFAVVGETKPAYISSFSTYYESVVVFGPLVLIEEEKEKRESLVALAEKYLPEHMDKAESDINRGYSRTAVYALEMEIVSGKANKPKK